MRTRSKLVLVGSVVLVGNCRAPRELQPLHPADLVTATRVAAQPGPRVDTTIVTTVRESSLIFEGVVLKRDTSAVADVPSHSTAVVRIGRVFRWPAPMDDLSGDTVIVVLADPTGLAVGNNAVFFSYGLSVDSTVVVQELRRELVRTPDWAATTRGRIAYADSVITDADIRARSSPTRSDAVVLGRVESAERIPDSSAHRGSEHMPTWGRASVLVTSAFRARDRIFMNQRAQVLYAIGGSRLSQNAPELHAGDSRIFWLRRLSRLPAALRVGIDTTRQFFVLDANDTRQSSDSTRVARALSPIPGRPVIPPRGLHR